LVKRILIIACAVAILMAGGVVSSVALLKRWFHRAPVVLVWDLSRSWDQDIVGWPKNDTPNLWWIVDPGEAHLTLPGHHQLHSPFVQVQVRRIGRRVASVFIYRDVESLEEAQALTKSTLAEWSLDEPKTLESLNTYFDFWRHPPAGYFAQSRADWRVDGPSPDSHGTFGT